MKKQQKQRCKGVSDKDFIFDIFSNTGFLPNATSFFQHDQINDFSCEDMKQKENKNSTEPD